MPLMCGFQKPLCGERIVPRRTSSLSIYNTQEMLRKIRAQKGRFSPNAIPGQDMKLGPGGIREIEFFAQTRQLICGGRATGLRVPTTLGALSALAQARWIGDDTAGLLAADYTAHRTLEHRLQMMEDAQTHIFPKSEEARSRLAVLCGDRRLRRAGAARSVDRPARGRPRDPGLRGGRRDAKSPRSWIIIGI